MKPRVEKNKDSKVKFNAMWNKRKQKIQHKKKLTNTFAAIGDLDFCFHYKIVDAGGGKNELVRRIHWSSLRTKLWIKCTFINRNFVALQLEFLVSADATFTRENTAELFYQLNQAMLF